MKSTTNNSNILSTQSQNNNKRVSRHIDHCAGAIVFGKMEILSKIASIKNIMLSLGWQKARAARQRDLDLFLAQEAKGDTFYRDMLFDFNIRHPSARNKVKSFIKSFDTSHQTAECYCLVAVDFWNILKDFRRRPTFVEFQEKLKEHIQSIIDDDLRQEVSLAALETYPSYVKDDTQFMEKIKEIGFERHLVKGAYEYVCRNSYYKLKKMGILVGVQPNVLKARLLGYSTSDVTTFGGNREEGETLRETAIRELREEAGIDSKAYLDSRKAEMGELEGNTFYFEITQSLEVEIINEREQLII